MNFFFAMAGPAEVAFAQALVLAWLAIGIVAILILVAWWKRSLRCNLAALLFSLVAGMLFGPSDTFFGPTQPPEILSDPDYIHWLSQFRIMSVVWILVTLVAVGLAVLGKFPIHPHVSQSETCDASGGKSSPVNL
jgi:hypothetical protein